MEISDRYVSGEPGERFLEYACGGGKIARGVHHKVSQIRSFLDGGRIGDVRGCLRIPYRENGERSDSILDRHGISQESTGRVVDPVNERTNRRPRRNRKTRKVERR